MLFVENNIFTLLCLISGFLFGGGIPAILERSLNSKTGAGRVLKDLGPASIS